MVDLQWNPLHARSKDGYKEGEKSDLVIGHHEHLY
jgi:hypothetical protein